MFTKKEALQFVGGLSKTSKMPGWSWSISAKRCRTGSVLRDKPGSTCAKCYALKGNYTRFKTVQQAMERRLQASRFGSVWVNHMVAALTHCVDPSDPYFRWFDSGDLQGYCMLHEIVDICIKTGEIGHWLPTREIAMLKELERNVKGKIISIPDNLIIRRSDTMIGERTVDRHPWIPELGYTSGVMPKEAADVWPELVAKNNSYLYRCPAPLQGNSCGDCRACWDPIVRHIDYLEH